MGALNKFMGALKKTSCSCHMVQAESWTPLVGAKRGSWGRGLTQHCQAVGVFGRSQMAC
jgi:hypothetical protein